MSTMTSRQSSKLRKMNISAGVLHLASLVAILLLSNSFSLPVTATYMSGPPGTTYASPITLFSNNVSYIIAGFFALSAFFHFLVSSRFFFAKYINGLQHHKNIFRWVEYSLSSSLMIYVIAQLCGISDYAALLAIVGTNASMIFFGWLQEKFVEPGTGQWLPFILVALPGRYPGS